VKGVVIVWALASALPIPFQIARLQKAHGVARAERTLLKRLITLGLRYHLGMIAIFLVLRVDIFMLNSMTSDARVGIYSLAVTLAESTFLFTDSVAQASVSRQLATRDDHLYTARLARTNLLLASVLVLSMVLVGPFLIPFVFGEAFGATVGPLLALAPGVVALAMQKPIGVFIVRQNRPHVVSAASVVALALHVLLNLTLIPRFGIIGAGIASSLTYIGLAIFNVAWFLRSSGVGRGSLIPRAADLSQPLAAIRRELLGRSSRQRT